MDGCRRLPGCAVGVTVVDLSAVDAGIVAAFSAAVNFVTLVARARLAVLPEPGEGLPGLPTDNP